MQLGIIGTGQIGGMLATAFAKTKQPQIVIFNRTAGKAAMIQQKYPDQIQIADSTESIITTSDFLFLCLKSSDTRNWLAKWGDLLTPNHFLIMTTSQISLAEAESMAVSQIAKVIPSITQAALSGYLLYALGSRTEEMTRAALLHLLSQIGLPLAIDENKARIYADLSSCGPAFFATMIHQMAEEAEKKGVPLHTAELMVVGTLMGTIQLIRDNHFTLEEIIQKVSVPGGVTEAGVKLLDQALPNIFQELFEATENRHREIDASS